jgi:thiosulfate/3-mercaptopyruvate sulfurtransferase
MKLSLLLAVIMSASLFTMSESLSIAIFGIGFQNSSIIIRLLSITIIASAWAGRLIWNLHCLGFNHTSLINGGIHAWLGAGLPTTADIDKVTPVSELVQVNLNSVQQYRVEYNELLQQVQQQNIQLWDCRTHEEYTGLRLAARRGGHIPNALHFEWSTALNRENHLKLHPLERTQQRLEQLGFNLQQPVVVYCQSHHRSGLAYILARLLNWQVRAYDGAWSEWGNRLDSPIISGESPS